MWPSDFQGGKDGSLDFRVWVHEEKPSTPKNGNGYFLSLPVVVPVVSSTVGFPMCGMYPLCLLVRYVHPTCFVCYIPCIFILYIYIHSYYHCYYYYF